MYILSSSSFTHPLPSPVQSLPFYESLVLFHCNGFVGNSLSTGILRSCQERDTRYHTSLLLNQNPRPQASYLALCPKPLTLLSAPSLLPCTLRQHQYQWPSCGVAGQLRSKKKKKRVFHGTSVRRQEGGGRWLVLL